MKFDHERIPERVVHARGAGAFGTFKLYESADDVTNAGVLTDTSRTTPVFVRFSTVLGSRGSADTVRDVRGFAIKFYTDEGNWVCELSGVVTWANLARILSAMTSPSFLSKMP